jgi:hypothetical protein
VNVNDLEHGTYYTLRGAENITLVAWYHDEQWWLEDDSGAATYAVRDGALIMCDFMGNEIGPSNWTLADVIPDSPEAATAGELIESQIDATARELLDDVDI